MSKSITLDKIQPFDSSKEDFSEWCGNLQSILLARDMDSDEYLNLLSEQDESKKKDEEECTGSENGSFDGIEEEDFPKTMEMDEYTLGVIQDDDETRPSKSNSNIAFLNKTSTSTFSLSGRNNKLSPTLRGMLGEAHLRFARGERLTAIDICLEVIKEAPSCPDPYSTLAMIYENEPEKSLQYLLISALLKPSGFKDWDRLGQLSTESGNNSQAIMCFRKAILISDKDPNLFWKLAHAQQENEDYKGALRTCQRALAEFEDNGKACVKGLRLSACFYHKLGDSEKAYESLTTAVKTYPEFITSSEINLLLDLCISMKYYVEACQLLMKFEKVKFIPSIPEIAFNSRESLTEAFHSKNYGCSVPDSIPTELLGKLIITLVHLGAFNVIESLHTQFRKANVERYGDLYLDVAESFMARKKYKIGFTYLTPLIQSKNYSQAAVWLRYAECLYLMNRIEEAVPAYKEVVKLAPNHTLARLNLSIILQKLGRTSEALNVLKDGSPLNKDDVQLIDPDLLMEKCTILYRKGYYNEFLESASILLHRHSVEILRKDDPLVIVMASNAGRRQTAVLHERMIRKFPDPEILHKFIEKTPSLEREYKLYLRMCRLLSSMERWDLLCAITYSACTSQIFSKVPAIENECVIHSFYASIRRGENYILPQHLRITVTRYRTNVLVLNFLTRILLREHSRYTKHVLRLVRKPPKVNSIVLLHANVNFTSGNYRNALINYLGLYSKTPTNPLVHLMISLSFLHLFSQKASQNRTTLFGNAIAFMSRYIQLRGRNQETYYNLGRCFHWLKLTSLAIYNYKKVLEIDPIEDDTLSTKNNHLCDRNLFNLKYEAAYNLSRIYLKCGAVSLARSIMYEYIQI